MIGFALPMFLEVFGISMIMNEWSRGVTLQDDDFRLRQSSTKFLNRLNGWDADFHSRILILGIDV